MEVAQARFPFPPPGHPPLPMIALVQYLLDTDIAQLLEDDPEHNLVWSKSFRDFLSRWSVLVQSDADHSLERQFDKRPSPEQIMQHTWVVGMQKLRVNMEKWIREAWGWKN